MISGAVGPGDHEHHKSSIWLVSILGGEPRKLRSDAYRAVISPDDSLIAYMGRGWGIWLAEADGENPREFIAASGWEILGSPQWSFDGRRVVYRRLGSTDAGPAATIESRGLDDEASTVLVRTGAFTHEGVVWAEDFLMLEDRLIFVMDEPAPRSRDRNLWEIAVDPRSGEPSGEPRRLTDWAGFDLIGLSTTADGSQLVFRNDHSQYDVYVGELGDGGRSLDTPRRLTLDDRNDKPSAWTPDGRSVVFQSDRNGNGDVFVQDLDQRAARELVLGAEEQSDARLTPDGSSFLYWESREGASESPGPRRLLRIPVEGGPTELVAEANAFAEFGCATTPGGPCYLGEVLFREGVFASSRLDPVEGKGEELWRWTPDPGVRPVSALSPDGRTVALVGHVKQGPSIRLLDALTGDVIRDFDVNGLSTVDFSEVEWAHDGSGFFLVGESTRKVMLLRVDLQGEAHVLYEEQIANYDSLRPSPDGRHLAFGKETWDTNSWIIEEF